MALALLVVSGAAGSISASGSAENRLSSGARADDLAGLHGGVAGKSTLSFEDRLMELVNEVRWLNGQLPPLKRNAFLDAAAELHSDNMASRDFYAHCDLDTHTWPWDRAGAVGYSGAVGENLMVASSSPDAVMGVWMGSAGHRDRILSISYREIGIGYAYDALDTPGVRQDSYNTCAAQSTTGGPWYHYWTLDFGIAVFGYPVVIDREAPSTQTRSVQLFVYGGEFASEIRIRNEGGVFTAWQPHVSDLGWTLSAGNGLKTVTVEMRNDFGTTVVSSDTILFGTAVVFADGFESGSTAAWSP